MSESSNFGFAKLVPGFDFLQNLAKGATQSLPQMPQLASWVAPTLNVEELEKRIAELKAVQFWLDQNGRALGATIQALEVQKMTLATLQGMNFSMGELANALKLKTPDSGSDTRAAGAPKPREAADAAAEKAAASAEAPRKKSAKAEPKSGNGAPVDPLQWWGALTQQFQQIAADAMKDVAQKTAADAARHKAAGAREAAAKGKAGVRAEAPAAEPTAQPAKKPARKAAARKPRAKTTP